MLPLLALSALLAPAQDPAVQGPPQAPPAREGRTLPRNGIYLVVNEEVVTLGEFYRALVRSGAEATTPEDQERLQVEHRVAFLREMLMTQAGRDLGFDPERVRALVEEDRSRMIERSGSVTAFSERLRTQRMSPEDLRQQREDFYYGLLWRAAVTGESQGASGRPYVDRYVRPGRLLYEFRRQPADRILPETVRIQEIVLTIGGERDAQQTKDLADELRQRALAGEDFGKLAQGHSSSPSKLDQGRIPGPTRVEDAVRVLPELADFFENGRAGDVSEPVPVRSKDDGELEAFQILRLEEVDRPGEVALADARVQEALRERRIDRLSRRRVDRALVELFDAAYVWPPARVDAEESQESDQPDATEPGASR